MYLPAEVREKIEKLLALTVSSNEHEAALAMEKTQAVVAENNHSFIIPCEYVGRS